MSSDDPVELPLQRRDLVRGQRCGAQDATSVARSMDATSIILFRKVLTASNLLLRAR
jgi:hypothetical protein